MSIVATSNKYEALPDGEFGSDIGGGMKSSVIKERVICRVVAKFERGATACYYVIACSFSSMAARPNMNNSIQHGCYTVMLTFIHSISDSNGKGITWRGYR